jgi:alanyl-tRNA synthetase
MPRTERLYYDQPSRRVFDATVVRVGTRGGHPAVWLDCTAFYPTSGGQPFDLGTLGGVPVVDVQDDEEGDVAHVLAADPPIVGSDVRCEIEWPRRFDHMQQHTGQHVLSAALEHAFQARTVSFHLGTESSTIDIDRELTPAQIAAGELEANRFVWNDTPVLIRYVTEEEARELPLRKEPARSGTLRLIEIEGVDLSACGGTHVDRTGAIGQIAVASWERFKGGQRVEFLCGGRALARFQQLRDVLAASIRRLSVLPPELPGAIERLQGELKEQARALNVAQLELAKYEAVALVAAAEPFAQGRVVLRTIDGDAARLKALASAAAAQPGVLAVLVSRSTPVLAVAARSADLAVSCHEIIAALAGQFGGRGGGKPDLAQCGNLQVTSEEVLVFARSLIT